MKKPTSKPRRNGQHAVLLKLPVSLHRQLVARAESQHRSTVAHLRHLIERDLEDAA